LQAAYTISDLAIDAVSKCLSDEPVATTHSRAKLVVEVMEHLPTEPLRERQTGARPLLSARKTRLLKEVQDRRASDRTATAKKSEES